MIIKTASLTPEQRHIILDKGTEYPTTGEFDEWDEPGTYICRQCGLPLYRADDKFHSGCGWPSFDEEIEGSVRRQLDADGQRTEILCARCDAHLGHVFHGEALTAKNTRHCVNSISLDFVPSLSVKDTDEAIFAAGCFWGVEYYFKHLPGVVKTQVGYSGGHVDNPTYEEICDHGSGHFEVIRVLYDPNEIDFKRIAQFFIEIHDPTQVGGQGPDIGEQYLSVGFYYNDAQREILEELIDELERQGYTIATQLRPVETFWRAESYHQDYYHKKGGEPYCHVHTKRFEK